MGELRYNALLEISKASGKKEQYNRPFLRVSPSMEYVTVRSKAWDEIVEAAGNEQHFEQTLQEIIPSKRESGILPRDGRPVPIFNLHDRSIPLAAFGLVKSKTLLANLKTLAKKKHVAQALQVANGIWDARVKFRALMEIAEATGEKQHYDLALQVANNFKDAREKSEALLRSSRQP